MTYLDKGFGKLEVQVFGNRETSARPDRFLGLTRSDTGGMVTARMRKPGIPAANVGGLSVRVGLLEEKEHRSRLNAPYCKTRLSTTLISSW